MPWLARGARAADAGRFALGIASGQPRARRHGAVDAAHRHRPGRARAGALGSRPRRAFQRRRRQRRGESPRPRGRTACTPSPPASSPAAGTGTASARSASRAPSAARAPRRPADAGGDAALRDRQLPALRRRPLRRLAPRRAPRTSTSSCSSATTSTRRRRGADALRRHEGDRGAHPRRVPRPLRHLQERPAAAGGARGRAVAAGLGRPRGRQRLRRPAGARTSSPTSRARRAAAYRAYWEHMPFPKSVRPRGADMRIVGRLDWGRLARIHLLDDRQYRDPQACPRPGRGGSQHRRARRLPGARRSAAQPARRRAGALARRRLGHWRGPGTWSRSRR